LAQGLPRGSMGHFGALTEALEKRKAAYEKAPAQIDADNPQIYLRHPTMLFAHSTKLAGYKQQPDDLIRLQDMTLAK
jgi:peptide/nickel transport system substrate-binding protein